MLIAMREPAECDTGHLARAVNFARGPLYLDVHPARVHVCNPDPALWHNEQAMAMVCCTGYRSWLASLCCQRMGSTHVRLVAGGVIDWVAAGLPLTMHLGHR